MKKNWAIKKLSEVCEEIFAGGDVPKNNHSKIISDKHNIPIYTNGEKNKGLYGYTDVFRVSKPCITVSARGTIGYSEIRNEKFYPAIRLIVVIPKSDILDLYYLKYAINRVVFTSSGASIPQLTVPMIKEYTIPIPTLCEQREIVVKLDAMYSEIYKLEDINQKRIENLEELKKSILHKAFTNQ